MRYRNAGRVLIVDDEPANIEVAKRLMLRLGYEVVTAVNGELALEAVGRDKPDIILLDVNMPVLDGLETCRRLKRDPATRLIPVVLITALTALEDRIQGIEAGADDFLNKPFVPAELEARVRSLTRLKRYTDELDSAESVIMSLALIIEARDPYTMGHCQRLAGYGTAFGEHLGLDAEQQVALFRGGFLHDIGKVGIPDAVLLKQSALDAAERAVMQQHPVIGETLCRELRLLADVCPIVRHHHERCDGTGYPDGLAGPHIPMLAQLMSIVDAYDAMTTNRPYKAAVSSERACAELHEEARKGWKRRDLVEEFASLISKHESPIGLSSPIGSQLLRRWKR